MSAVTTEPTLSWPDLLAYGSVRMPLALLELPLFVLLPILYNRSYGLGLGVIGLTLFATRAVDAIADPLIGGLLDRWRAQVAFSTWVRYALPVLALGFTALLLPPVRGDALAVWLAIASIIAYIAYSLVSIAYQAWGASLTGSAVQQVRLTTTREAFGLLGVLIAASLLDPGMAGPLCIAFALLAVLAMVWSSRTPMRLAAPSLSLASRTAALTAVAASNQPSSLSSAPVARRVGAAFAGWDKLHSNQTFRWLMLAFMFNGIATAIPATLVLFFAADVLHASSTDSALFLAAYFLAAALGMPVWMWLAQRIGLRNAWLLGILMAVIGFLGTLWLGAGDKWPFTLVCIGTGLALGSDLAMPPAMLALAIDRHGDRGKSEGAYFGLWNLATKLNLAIAAGLALPLTQWLSNASTLTPAFALTLVYAALPSLLKLVAGAVLLLAPRPETSI